MIPAMVMVLPAPLTVRMELPDKRTLPASPSPAPWNEDTETLPSTSSVPKDEMKRSDPIPRALVEDPKMTFKMPSKMRTSPVNVLLPLR